MFGSPKIGHWGTKPSRGPGYLVPSPQTSMFFNGSSAYHLSLTFFSLIIWQISCEIHIWCNTLPRVEWDVIYLHNLQSLSMHTFKRNVIYSNRSLHLDFKVQVGICFTSVPNKSIIVTITALSNHDGPPGVVIRRKMDLCHTILVFAARCRVNQRYND